jgi:hypothetical protein
MLLLPLDGILAKPYASWPLPSPRAPPCELSVFDFRIAFSIPDKRPRGIKVFEGVYLPLRRPRTQEIEAKQRNAVQIPDWHLVSQKGLRRATDESQGDAYAETNSWNPAGGLPCDEHGLLGAEPLHRPVEVRLLEKQNAR